MNPILDPPRTLLLVGTGDAISDGALETLLGGEPDDVRHAESCPAARDVLETRDDVGCVLTARSFSEHTIADLCETVRSIDRDLPVVVQLDEEPGPSDRETVGLGPTSAIPADVAPDRLRAVVDDAVSTYVRRRRETEQSDMLDALLSSIGEAIYFKDTGGRHVRIGKVPGGFDPETARGKTDLELYGDDDPEAAREAYEDDVRVVTDEEPVFDRIERVGDDRDLWMRTTKVPWIDDHGEVRGLIGLTINVTKYKQAERRLEELSHRFETFTGRLSHDVKTPLQVASGNLDVALENADEGAIRTARDAIERAEQIIGDYETLSNQARETREETTPVELDPVVRDVWGAIESGDAQLSVGVDEGVYVNATEEMVRPVVENLLKNAVAHTDSGVTVRTGTTDGGFYVEDDGRGIPESERQKVLKAGYTTADDGSGRGLSIVKNQMDKHVWSLELTDSPEGGARFTIHDCLADTGPSGLATGAAEELEIDERAAVGDLDWGGHVEYEAEFDEWHVTSDGVDIHRQDNEFQYAFATADGPASIQGRVVGVEYVDDFSKGGFMIRDSTSPDASYVFVGQTPGHGSEILCRDARGENGYSVPVDDNAFRFDWYRLDRVDDEVRLLLSMDGEHWQRIDTRSVEFADSVHVGMVSCSCVPGRPCKATFQDVRAVRIDR